LPNKEKKPSKNEEMTTSEAVELAEVEAKVAAAKASAAKAMADAEAEREYEEAKAIVKATGSTNKPFTDKRAQERIFRREMGEPEFFRYKKDLVPLRHVLTDEEAEEISRKVEIATDHTPPYKPDHILSPEFAGTSNYESGLSQLVQETRQKLDKLKSDPQANVFEIAQAEQDLMYLDSLYQNYYYGMNVFRTAKGGRAKLHE
jgi:colicin import membrane protein